MGSHLDIEFQAKHVVAQCLHEYGDGISIYTIVGPVGQHDNGAATSRLREQPRLKTPELAFVPYPLAVWREGNAQAVDTSVAGQGYLRTFALFFLQARAEQLSGRQRLRPAQHISGRGDNISSGPGRIWIDIGGDDPLT